MTRQELLENLMVAVDTLRSHKVRSGLTILGIVIGVTSVISVASIIQGLNNYIANRVESFGTRTYFVFRLPVGRFGRPPEKIRKRKYLEAYYAPAVREGCRACEMVTVFGTRAFFFGETNYAQYGANRVERVFIRGAEPEYVQAIPLFAVEKGRFISRLDEEHSTAVVVLGAAIAESLFGNLEPVGKVIRMNGRQFEVIGVFEHDPGLFGGGGVDSFAIIPFSLFRKEYPNSKELALAFSVGRDANPEAAKDQVIEIMRRLRRVPHNAENDFELASPDFLTNLWSQLTGALVILTSVISSVGLLVGGIGVMNIMLISVTERTAEIGVRKAIGARRSDIRVQFLLEAVLLTAVGGLIGIVLGGLIAFLVRSFVPNVPATLSMLWISLGVAISVGVGIFFGYYPANRAANLDPIVCLRYE
ncbi:MAG TPA: ABC transporter permease [Bryobacteraceae bacterium]|nr:ABC transporter permease [Bryobacteraceae bacterium]